MEGKDKDFGNQEDMEKHLENEQNQEEKKKEEEE
jgi:hypothetical protein